MQTKRSRFLWPAIVLSVAIPSISSGQSSSLEPCRHGGSVSSSRTASDTARVVMVTAPEGIDTTFVTLDPPRWEEGSDNRRNPTADALQRVEILTLDDAELAGIGALPDESGVWIASRGESGAIQAIHVGSGGTQFDLSEDPKKWEGITIPTWRPVLVTDEQGIWRLHEFDGDSIAPDLARQERALPVGSDERFRISEQIGMRAEEHLVGRLDELIPILIVATGPGSGWSEGSTRSIAVLWYERTPELLAALPKRLERDSVLGSAGEIGVTGRRNVASVRPSPDGSERAAFADAGISPNPVGELAHLSFTIGAPSDVTLQVHDLRGEVVLGIPPVSCTTAGRWQIAFDTANLPPGMYIARLQNGQGASATTRFVVPSRRGKE